VIGQYGEGIPGIFMFKIKELGGFMQNLKEIRIGRLFIIV